MKQSAVFLALAALTVATPLPQLLDLATVIAPDEVAPNVTTPMGKGATSQVITYVAPVLPLVAPAPSGTSLAKRDGDCSPQPAGSGPVASPDTDAAFLADSDLANTANSASTPSGYTLAFQNLQGSSQTSAYLGYYSYDSYDTNACAAKCSSTTGCISFNILFERDPSLDPGSGCPNPASTTVIKCVLWGTVITPETATNTGQYRNNFHVVIAGSNGYIRSPSSADSVSGYTGTYVGNAAVNAPLDCNGHSTYITYKEFSNGQPFSAARCAAACETETQYNIQHLDSRSICRFFNTYLLLKNGVPQGQICSLYNTTWPATPAILSNTGQYSGNDHYTIANSEIYSDINDSGELNCPSDIARVYLEQPDNAAFCSSYISYAAPTTTVSAITTISTATTTTLDITVASTQSPIKVTAAPRLRRSDADASPVPANSINTDIFPWANLPASILSSLTATASGVNKRAVLPTPTSVASWPASMLSAACSEVATGTATQTTITSTSTVFTSTQTVLSTTTSVAPAPTVTVIPSLTCFNVKDTTTGDYLSMGGGNFAGVSSNKAFFKQHPVAGQQSSITTTDGLVFSTYTLPYYTSNAPSGFARKDYYTNGQDPLNVVEIVTCLPASDNGLTCTRPDHPEDVLAAVSGRFNFVSRDLPSEVKAAVLVTETVDCP